MGEIVRAAEAALNEEDAKEITCSCMDVHCKDTDFSDDTQFSSIVISRRIDLSKKYPDIKFLLKRNNAGCLPLGEIIALKAKAKAGKTTTESIFETALKKGNFMGFQSTSENIKSLFIDTEQSVLSTAKFAKRVHRLVGWSEYENHPLFMALNLRADETTNRPGIIEQAIKEYRPHVVYLDGVKDLLFDINSQIEATNIVNFLLRLTKEYGCTLVCVLHENKADANLRGSIGSELLNKCAECWQVKKDADVFEAQQTECRNQPVEGFSFRLDAFGMPEPLEIEPTASKAEQALQKKVENFKCCMKPHFPIPYTELRKVYAETSGLTEKTAEAHISYAIKHGWIERQANGEYLIRPLRLPL